MGSYSVVHRSRLPIDDIDRVILPSETRVMVTRGLRALRNKRANRPPKKHGNIPL